MPEIVDAHLSLLGFRLEPRDGCGFARFDRGSLLAKANRAAFARIAFRGLRSKRDLGEPMTFGNDIALGDEHLLNDAGGRGGGPDQPSVRDHPAAQTLRLSIGRKPGKHCRSNHNR